MRRTRWTDLKQGMPVDAQARVDDRVRATIAAMPLADIRRALGITQTDVAAASDVAQGTISRFERASDMHVSTLARFVEAMGGRLVLKAVFPDGREFDIEASGAA